MILSISSIILKLPVNHAGGILGYLFNFKCGKYYKIIVIWGCNQRGCNQKIEETGVREECQAVNIDTVLCYFPGFYDGSALTYFLICCDFIKKSKCSLLYLLYL